SLEIGVDSVTFRYGKRFQTARALTYIRRDLSNHGIDTAFANYISRAGVDASLLKAPQYLPQRSDFSTIARLIRKSPLVIQSDSGIALRDFDSQWSIRL